MHSHQNRDGGPVSPRTQLTRNLEVRAPEARCLHESKNCAGSWNTAPESNAVQAFMRGWVFGYPQGCTLCGNMGIPEQYCKALCMPCTCLAGEGLIYPKWGAIKA